MESNIGNKNKVRPFDISLLSFGKRMLCSVYKRDILIREALECVRFYFTAYGVRRALATLPRSGVNYMLLVFNIALDIAQGGTGDYYYQQKDWKSNYNIQASFDWRTPVKRLRSGDTYFRNPIIFHTNVPYHQIENLQKANMRTVVVVRNLFNQLESRLFHMGYNASNQDEFLRAGYVDLSIGFFNSWGKFLQNHDAFLVKYEDIIQDPYEAIKNILHFWEGFDLPESSIRIAIARCSKEEMIKRIPKEVLLENPRVSVRKQKGVFSTTSIKFIKDKIKKNLRYHLGYDYSKA